VLKLPGRGQSTIWRTLVTLPNDTIRELPFETTIRCRAWHATLIRRTSGAPVCEPADASWLTQVSVPIILDYPLNLKVEFSKAGWKRQEPVLINRNGEHKKIHKELSSKDGGQLTFRTEADYVSDRKPNLLRFNKDNGIDPTLLLPNVTIYNDIPGFTEPVLTLRNTGPREGVSAKIGTRRLSLKYDAKNLPVLVVRQGARPACELAATLKPDEAADTVKWIRKLEDAVFELRDAVSAATQPQVERAFIDYQKAYFKDYAEEQDDKIQATMQDRFNACRQLDNFHHYCAQLPEVYRDLQALKAEAVKNLAALMTNLFVDFLFFLPDLLAWTKGKSVIQLAQLKRAAKVLQGEIDELAQQVARMGTRLSEIAPLKQALDKATAGLKALEEQAARQFGEDRPAPSRR
jgi:hypothetical protein